jgi:hypothetical protein
VTGHGLFDLRQLLLPQLLDNRAQGLVLRGRLHVIQQLQLHDAVVPAAEQRLQRLAQLDQFFLRRTRRNALSRGFRLVADLFYSDA